MQESGRLRKVRRFFFQSLINEIITLVWVRRLIRHFRVSRANAERGLTPVSLCKRPLGEYPSPETGGMLLSACQSYFPDRSRTYSFCPVSQSHIDFLERHMGVRMKGSLWNAAAITLLCLSAIAWSSFLRSINSFGFTWFAELKKLIKSETWYKELNLRYFTPMFWFFWFVFFLPTVSICLALLFGVFYFPCCILRPHAPALSGFVCRKQRIWVCRLGYQRRWCLSVSPCGTLAVPYHVLLIPSV